MKLFLIVNPVAGKGNSLKALPVLCDYLKKNKIKFDLVKTEYKGHAKEIARRAVSSDYTAIVAVGGDGTVLETVNGMIGSSIPLAIIPAGTGNDFARALHIPDDTIKAVRLILEKPYFSVDVGRLGQMFFLNVASVGFDAEIIRDLYRIKRWIPGKAAYYISVFTKFLTYRYKDVTINVDGRVISTSILLTAVANGCFYGGGMNVNPKGSPSDGLLDIICITKVPRYKIPLLLKKFVKGQHLDLPYVTYLKGKEVSIESAGYVINADGDIVASTPIKFSLMPLALNVYKG